MKKINFTLLLPGEIISAILRFITLAKEYGIKDPFILKIMGVMEKDAEKMNQSLLAIRVNEMAEELFASDARRDKRFMVFRDGVAANKNEDEDKALMTAYKKVWPVIEKAGTTLYALGYDEQSGKMDALIHELLPADMQAALKKMNLVGKFNKMKQAQADFMALFNQSLTSEVQKKEYPAIRKLKWQIAPNLRYFIDTFRFLKQNEPETYTEIAKKMNEITIDIMTPARARQTRKEGGKEEDEFNDFDVATE